MTSLHYHRLISDLPPLLRRYRWHEMLKGIDQPTVLVNAQCFSNEPACWSQLSSHSCNLQTSQQLAGNSAIIRLLMTVGGTGDDGDGETR